MQNPTCPFGRCEVKSSALPFHRSCFGWLLTEAFAWQTRDASLAQTGRSGQRLAIISTRKSWKRVIIPLNKIMIPWKELVSQALTTNYYRIQHWAQDVYSKLWGQHNVGFVHLTRSTSLLHCTLRPAVHKHAWQNHAPAWAGRFDQHRAGVPLRYRAIRWW